jgi:serine/threonine protein kinase
MFAKQGDLVVLLSAGGNSQNIKKAAAYCQDNNIFSIGLIGGIKPDLGNCFNLELHINSVNLQIVEDILKIDHRDLKVNNILVVDEPKEIQVTMGTVKKRCIFPFYIVFIDFGFACIGDTLDIRTDGLPPIDTCPKEGRDIFQILVSIWRIDTLRSILEEVWGNWFHSKINSAGNYIQLTEKAKDLTWMYAITEDKEFKAPLCTPNSIIKDCFRFLDL